MANMTDYEMSYLSDVVAELTDYALKLIAANSEAIAELAANELIVRRVRGDIGA